MYVNICICVFACMCACVYVCVHTCMNVCLSVCVFVCVYVCVDMLISFSSKFKDEAVVFDPSQLEGRRLDFLIMVPQGRDVLWVKEDSTRGVYFR